MLNPDVLVSNGTGSNGEGVVTGRAGVVVVGPARSLSREIPQQCMIRVASLNVGTMSGRTGEVVETLERRKVDVCCAQETRWRGGSARMITGKNSRYKLFWSGDSSGYGGVGVLIAEKWVDKVLSVTRCDSRLMQLRLLVGKQIMDIWSAYAPQSGLTDEVKDSFFSNLLSNVIQVPDSETLVVAGDLNGHVGRTSNGFDGLHGGHGFGTRNPDGTRILDMCAAADLVITNTFFCKSDSRLVTYRSGANQSQVDFILTRKSDLKLVQNANVIASEECVTQHKLLVCDLALRTTIHKPRPNPPKRRLWKLNRPEILEEFKNHVSESVSSFAYPSDVNESWIELKSCLTNACDTVCGWTKGGGSFRRETWWWNDEVEASIQEKRKLWKEWQKGGSKEPYLQAKRRAKYAVYTARKESQAAKFGDLSGNDQRNLLFKEARKMKGENQDIVGDKCVLDDDGKLAIDEQAKLSAWKAHYERLLNVEFDWDRESLQDQPPVQGPPINITVEMVAVALQKMKKGKAAGPSGITVEMILAAGDSLLVAITHLANRIIYESVIPEDWDLSYIVNCFKGKGDSLERGNFRGLKLIEQVLKIVERILESVIRSQISIDSMQFGFMPGRGTTDAIFILRQLHEKYLGKKKNVYFAFVDLEKAFDRVPRSVLWWAMRKLGIDEWIIRVVQAMYANAKSSVRVNGQYSSDFGVKVGVHQGSVLSPLLFIIVMEALSREFRTGCPWELLYADDLVIVADSIEELLAKLGTWKRAIEGKGLRVNMGKTKIICSRHSAPKPIEKSRFPCGVCFVGVGRNSILCTSCKHWIHKACTDLKGRLIEDPSYKCKRCRGLIPEVAPPDPIKMELEGEELDVVTSFCYLGDVTGESGGCFDATTARIRSAWKKFRELLPILTCRGISLSNRGNGYNMCVRSVLLHACETWPVTTVDITRLCRTDHAMIRWICSSKLADRDSLHMLRSKLGLASIEEVLRWSRLRWFGHLQRMDKNIWPRKIESFVVPGSYPKGRPRKRWLDCINEDLRHTHLKPEQASNRTLWRSRIHPGGQRNSTSNPRSRGTKGRKTVQ